MNESSLEDIQNLLRKFQKKMMTKSTTVRGQWNCVTCLKKLSQVQLARRMNVFGINATVSEVAQLFHYMGFKKNSMNFEDFMNLMEVDPALLGTNTKSLSQPKELFEHETMREYENDYNNYCRNTTNYIPSASTRGSYAFDQTNRKTKKSSRPFTASTSQISKNSDFNSKSNRSRKQNDVIRSNKNRSNTNSDDDDRYNEQEDHYTQQDDQYTHQDNHHEHEHDHDHDNDNDYSSTLGSSGTFSYEPCRTCLERSLPRTVSSKKTREATLRSFSSSSIQRQEYDGTDPLKSITQNSGTPLRTLVRKISDIAYAAHPSSWSCFLKWRDPHHDLLDANDLRNGLKYADNYIITKAEAQKVIDKYGGPMNHSTFAEMLHDGSQFNTSKPFNDDEI